jgi:hypothetical protein
MARPSKRTISSGLSAWDADVDFNDGLGLTVPMPLYQEATTGALPDAALYEDCFALVGTVLYKSDGTSWEEYINVPELDYIADLAASPTVEEISTAFNSLLADLQAKGYMVTS